MTFKDIIKRDVQQTFLNVDEFSEIHTVNGKPMAVQIDNNEQIEREKRYSQHMDGIYVKQVLMYVSAEDYGPLPKQGTAAKTEAERISRHIRQERKAKANRDHNNAPFP